jgi:hypothetical protein
MDCRKAGHGSDFSDRVGHFQSNRQHHSIKNRYRSATIGPTGLPDPAHKSSAVDLAILARAIIHDSADYYPIYAEHDFKYNGVKQGNRNALLYTDPSVDGLKTGHTEEAGYTVDADRAARPASADLGGAQARTGGAGAQPRW